MICLFLAVPETFFLTNRDVNLCVRKRTVKNYIHKIDVVDVIIRRRRQDISLHLENGTHVKLLH